MFISDRSNKTLKQV